MLALLVGACFALAWILRLGWIADYFSRPVLIGCIHGVAVILDIVSSGSCWSVDRRARPVTAALRGRARALGAWPNHAAAPG
jgi:MFS superfamily sulfate permease-like transporter